MFVAKTRLQITQALPEHIPMIQEIGDYFDGHPHSMTAVDLKLHLHQFPEGQFVALLNGQVAGFALTMRTNHYPNEKPLPWIDAVGGTAIDNHAWNGKWLYGIDFVVAPHYRRQGIGSKLYEARFSLVKKLNLQGFYAGGMLIGYQHYHHLISVQEYAAKVMRGELKDPTVSMQMKRGFKPQGIIENYCDYPAASDAAMLIVWENPEYEYAMIERTA